MKNLDLTNPTYQQHLKTFKNWLQTLGYSKGTVYTAPFSVKEFLHFIEGQGAVKTNYAINTEIINRYFDYLSTRKNQRTSGALSYSYLEKNRSSIKLFFEFLRQNHQISIVATFPYIEKQRKTPQILTAKEIELLFKTCADDMLGKRDKAMLTLYYGCGLRKIEALRLDVEDIDLNKRLLFIQKTKTHRQRYVPISKRGVKIMEDYLYAAREFLLPLNSNEPAFLVSSRGNRMSEELPVYALRQLIEKTENQAIKQKQISLHILRHSIATHLLQKGMSLENIALFLGHRSLDSTQIYTHLATTITL